MQIPSLVTQSVTQFNLRFQSSSPVYIPSLDPEISKLRKVERIVVEKNSREKIEHFSSQFRHNSVELSPAVVVKIERLS